MQPLPPFPPSFSVVRLWYLLISAGLRIGIAKLFNVEHGCVPLKLCSTPFLTHPAHGNMPEPHPSLKKKQNWELKDTQNICWTISCFSYITEDYSRSTLIKFDGRVVFNVYFGHCLLLIL